MKQLFATQNSIGLFILRMSVGIMFAAHGSQKLFGAFGGSGIQGFTGHLTAMGLPNPELQAYLAAGSEFFGGLFLILGFVTRLSVFPLLAVMFVAVWKVHLAKGFFLQAGGFEYNFVITGALLALLALGGGKFSIDQKISKS